ncbi:Probable RNA-directed DNA polymerase from transposon X-element [Eumeta japonica]|uniref:Probable RNA-directed DNA polymerase from transposon X-element n=1 Tax=Eumeta variegata TaxID=151549 RepID=A0A4C1U739_EUMVA|nr:Probable RNA-directed DNA polymerase from transposon X-element [Eumeta japonica]
MEGRVQEFLSVPMPPLPWEIAKAIFQLAKRKDPGADVIQTVPIKYLPRRAMVAMTRLFNGILRTEHFPENCKMGHMISIPKAGKDSRLASSQRPITLLSCIASCSSVSCYGAFTAT